MPVAKKTIKKKETKKKAIKPKTIEILGKRKIPYKNIPELARLLNITTSPTDTKADKKLNAKRALNTLSNDITIYDKKTGKIAKINPTQKPLLLREWTEYKQIPKRFINEILVYPTTDIINKRKETHIQVKHPNSAFTTEDVVDLRYTVKFQTVDISGNEDTKEAKNGIYLGAVNPEDYEILTNLQHYTEWDDNEKESNDIYEYYKNDEWITLADNMMTPFIRSFIKYMSDHIIGWASSYEVKSIDIMNYNRTLKYDLENMRMFKIGDISDISTNLFNEVIEFDQINNCVVDWLMHKYKHTKIDIARYFKIKHPNYQIEGLSTIDIDAFCREHEIPYKAFGIDERVIKEYKPESKKGRKAVLCYIAHDEHLYPIKNPYLNKKESTKYEEKRMTSAELNEMFKNLMIKNIIPANVSMLSKTDKDSDEEALPVISSFIHAKTIHYANNDYDHCFKILEEFGISEQMKPSITKYGTMKKISKSNICFELTKLYNINYKSFFPQLADIQYDISLFKNRKYNEMIERNDILAIDKKRCYLSALWSLKQIMTYDIRTDGHIIFNSENAQSHEINNKYMYLVRPAQSSVLLPNQSIYSGEHLLFSKEEGCKFELLECFETTSHDNKYTQLIEQFISKTQKYYKNEEFSKFCKNIWNIYLGCMDRCDTVENFQSVSKICNDEEFKLSDGLSVKYMNKNIFVKNQTVCNIYTTKLIKLQVLAEARKIIYLKMKSLNIQSEDVLYIKTDAICFINRHNLKMSKIITKEDNTILTGWKSDICDIEFKSNYNVFLKDTNIIRTNNNDTTNALTSSYAGSGKSTAILKLCDELKVKDESFLIITPSHTSSVEYRKLGYPCKVIQHYEFNQYDDITQYKNIIIDEIGMVSNKGHNWIYMVYRQNKNNLYVYGDWEQLLSPQINKTDGEAKPLNKKSYLNLIFGTKQYFRNQNFRNNHTKEYYESLYQSVDDLYLQSELIKYNSKNIYDVDAVICSTNTICDKYNDLIMKHKKQTLYSEGLPLIIRDNVFRKQNIYNGAIVRYESKDEKYIYLADDISTYKITHKQYKNKELIRPAYARTIYSLQGGAVNSFYICPEDLIFFSKSGRATYTIISRLNEELTETTKKRNMINADDYMTAEKTTIRYNMMCVNFDNL